MPRSSAATSPVPVSMSSSTRPTAVNPFADLPEVIVTPHLGGGSRNSMEGVVERSTTNIRRFLAGEPVRDLVDRLMERP